MVEFKICDGLNGFLHKFLGKFGKLSLIVFQINASCVILVPNSYNFQVSIRNRRIHPHHQSKNSMKLPTRP